MTTLECTILAHRGNLHGPDRARENTSAAYAAALAAGFGLEIDVRRDSSGQWYVSHDLAAVNPANRLDRFADLFRRHADRVVAVNVKELDSAPDLAGLVSRGVFGDRAFLFDFELLEPAAPGRTQRSLRAGAAAAVPLASRMSDRGEPVEQCLAIPAGHVWADEFDGPWLTEAAVRRAREAGRRVWVISPELHGRGGPEERRGRWRDFKRWGVDGLCTDFAVEARAFFCN